VSPRLGREGAEDLSPAWRHLLETGQMPPDEILGPVDDLVDLFRAIPSRSRDRCAEVEPRWCSWRDVILADWRDRGRPGVCWGEWMFELGLYAGDFFRLAAATREQAAARRRRELAQLPRFPNRSAEISRGCVGIE
jgi:hypothetical protein